MRRTLNQSIALTKNTYNICNQILLNFQIIYNHYILSYIITFIFKNGCPS